MLVLTFQINTPISTTMKNIFLTLALIIGALTIQPQEVKAQEPMLAEVRLFAGNFAPRGWMKCEGQILPINQNHALFSLLGTIYGGDGRTTFALPDLRGKVVVGTGTETADRRPGNKVNIAANGNDGGQGLSMCYIIATTGMFPSRQ